MGVKELKDKNGYVTYEYKCDVCKSKTKEDNVIEVNELVYCSNCYHKINESENKQRGKNYVE